MSATVESANVNVEGIHMVVSLTEKFAIPLKTLISSISVSTQPLISSTTNPIVCKSVVLKTIDSVGELPVKGRKVVSLKNQVYPLLQNSLTSVDGVAS